MKRFAIFLAIIIALIGIDWLWDVLAYERPFKKVGRGDKEDRVIALFGKAYFVNTMPDHVTTAFDDGDVFVVAGADIVKTFCYWPWGIGGHYCISFDAQGRVVAKGRPPKL